MPVEKILMVAAEAKPYATAGGTRDVVGALARVLREKGCDVRLVLPYYVPSCTLLDTRLSRWLIWLSQSVASP